jgi:hypothetical protein
MRLHQSLLALFLALGTAPWPALAGDRRTVVFDGVTLLHRTDDRPAWEIHALIVDLSKAGVGLAGTPYAQRMKRTSDIGVAMNAQAAINGDFRSVSSSANLSEGLTISAGRKWPGTADNRFRGTFAWSRDLIRAELLPSGPVVTKEDWMRGLISGHPTILSGGTVGSWASGSFCGQRHPRTGLGLSADRRTLYLAVVDGRRSSSVGMSCAELGNLLKNLGAQDAMNLDGGGSTTMWLRGKGVVNTPSDGAERVVVNHLLVYANPAPASAANGVLRGKVHRAGDTSAAITGAKVRLDIGDQAISNANGIYRFSLPAGTYTGTVTAAGYQPARLTATVTAGNTTGAPVALTPQAGPTDRDFDGIADSADNCPELENADQTDTDADATGDACDADDDADGRFDEDDLCPLTADASQQDTDLDGQGDPCDADDDGDGALDPADNCPHVPNADQADADLDGIGNACAADRDADAVADALDNCPDSPNPDQRDLDRDLTGDPCDPDDDGDDVTDTADNCPALDNPGQEDTDQDGQGDACDPDLDGDGHPNPSDNCTGVANPDQRDTDGDGTGDLCAEEAPPPPPDDPDEQLDAGPSPVAPDSGAPPQTAMPAGGCDCGGSFASLLAMTGLALTWRRRTR